MVETLVHEGSHHATAYTDDVEFQGSKVLKKRRLFRGKSPEDMIDTLWWTNIAIENGHL